MKILLSPSSVLFLVHVGAGGSFSVQNRRFRLCWAFIQRTVVAVHLKTWMNDLQVGGLICVECYPCIQFGRLLVGFMFRWPTESSVLYYNRQSGNFIGFIGETCPDGNSPNILLVILSVRLNAYTSPKPKFSSNLVSYFILIGNSLIFST